MFQYDFIGHSTIDVISLLLQWMKIFFNYIEGITSKKGMNMERIIMEKKDVIQDLMCRIKE